MPTTPRALIDDVVRSVCGRRVDRLRRLTEGGLNEAYRARLAGGLTVVVRIARRETPWFGDEAESTTRARAAGIPAPEVLGVEHVDDDGGALSFSVLEDLPGRPLDAVAATLSVSTLEGLVMAAGELIAHLHGVALDGGPRHRLETPDDGVVARAVRAAEKTLGPAAAGIVARGVEFLASEASRRPAPALSLVHGDWLPKHLLVDGTGTIVGVIDWEFAGPAPGSFCSRLLAPARATGGPTSRRHPLDAPPDRSSFILSRDMRPDGERWRGRIYNPEDGRSYRATLTPRSADVLRLRGCRGPFCRNQTWRRLESIELPTAEDFD